VATIRVPKDLGEAGRAFVRQTSAWLKAERWELEPHEVEILLGAARQADRLVTIRAALATLEPDTPEFARLLRAELSSAVEFRRTIVVLGLPVGPQADDGKPIVLPNSRRAQKAGRARWSAESTRQLAAGA
jgi:hypothetical protein